MTNVTDYFLGEGSTEGDRLAAMAEGFRPDAEDLFDAVGLSAGAHVVDLGCGPLGALPSLSGRVGDTGRVLGLERAAHFVAAARAAVAERGLGNVEISQADVLTDELPADSFDLAHERLVLIQSSDPSGILTALRRLVKPGGIVAAEELDAGSWLCYPHHPAWEALHHAFMTVAESGGQSDPYYGRKLPAAMRAAGLTDIRVRAQARAYLPGEYFRTHLVRLAESVQDAIVSAGLLTEQDFRRHVGELRAHLDEPDTVLLGQTLFQAWGRKPE